MTSGASESIALQDVNNLSLKQDEGSSNGKSSVFSPYVNVSAIPPPTFQRPTSSPGGSPTKGDSKNLKKVARKATWAADDMIRKDLWYNMCCGSKRSEKSIYKDVFDSLFGGNGDADLAFPDFVDENLLCTYYLTDEGKQNLARVLCVLHNTRPDITYCPLAAPLASLLLHYMDSESAFRCLSALHDSKSYKFMEQTWVGHESFRMSFGKLVLRFSPQVHKLLERQTGNAEIVYVDWIFWILKNLSFHHLVRIIDCYLMEGLKIFYRVGLSVLQNYKKSKAFEGASDIPSSIQSFLASTQLTPEQILSVGFQFRGLSRSVIGSYQTKHKELLREDGSSHQRSSRTQNSSPLALRSVDSHAITPQQLQVLWKWLPDRISVYQPRLVFSTSEHGFSFQTFFRRCEYCEPSILLVKTSQDEVFGAYCSTCWSQRNEPEQKSPYFGTGECFLFSLYPEQKKYTWVGALDRGEVNGSADHSIHWFMRAEQRLIAIGGGDGDGLYFEDDLSKGRSTSCNTFNNPPLSKDGLFQCLVLEVFSFDDDAS